MPRFEDEDFTGAEFRECDLSGARLIGVFMDGAEIDGLVSNLVVNGVEVMSYVEAELDRRHPQPARRTELLDAVRLEERQGSIGGPGGPRPEPQEAIDIQKRIDAEIARVVASLRNEVSIARQRVGSIEGSLGVKQSDLAANNVGAVKLRDFCRSKGRHQSRSIRLETYKKAEAALVSFISGTPMSKIYGFEEEQFQIPGNA